jgi:transketolase
MNCAKQYQVIVTIEEHNISGGFSGAVSEVLARMSKKRAYQIFV